MEPTRRTSRVVRTSFVDAPSGSENVVGEEWLTKEKKKEMVRSIVDDPNEYIETNTLKGVTRRKAGSIIPDEENPFDPTIKKQVSAMIQRAGITDQDKFKDNSSKAANWLAKYKSAEHVQMRSIRRKNYDPSRPEFNPNDFLLDDTKNQFGNSKKQ